MDETQPLGGAGRPGAAGEQPTLSGRYELRGPLGQGGMADVVLAHDNQLDREVAVKILHARYAEDPTFLARFRREAQAAASLTHPNVVGVYDAGEQDGRPFIVMEHVSGRSLSERLADSRLTVERALEITGDAALGLHYAHERGLVHRDIKPGNILVADDGQVKVADFGIARAVNAENATQTASVFGTAAYIAPEQAQGQEVDRRTDVYALGCVLFELLTGRAPFQADSAVALAYKHVSEMPDPPSEHRSDLPPECDAIVLKAMAKDPDDRYPNARELNADLQRLQAGMPVLAPALGAWAASTQALDGDQTVALSPATGEPLAAPGAVEDEPDEPRSRRGLWLALLAIVVLALFALAGVLLAGILGQETAEVAVPDVVGMDAEDAQQALIDEGFVPVVADEREANPDFDENQVVRTDPTADALAPEGSEVELFLSEGPPLVTIPDLAGWPVDEAQQELLELGLGIGVQQAEPSDEFDEGVVIRTDPGASEEVEEGSEVSLVVSTGPETVTVPNVENRTEQEAEEALANACDLDPCFAMQVEREASDTVAEGRIISQDPGPNSEAAPGSTVAVLVSDGQATFEMIDVENQPEDTAIQRLQQACEPQPCVEVAVDREESGTVAEGRVIRQEPRPNTQVERGSTVRIVVSEGPPPEPEPDPDPPPDDDNDDNDNDNDDNDDNDNDNDQD